MCAGLLPSTTNGCFMNAWLPSSSHNRMDTWCQHGSHFIPIQNFIPRCLMSLFVFVSTNTIGKHLFFFVLYICCTQRQFAQISTWWIAQSLQVRVAGLKGIQKGCELLLTGMWNLKCGFMDPKFPASHFMCQVLIGLHSIDESQQ